MFTSKLLLLFNESLWVDRSINKRINGSFRQYCASDPLILLLIQGFTIRGFILIYERSACFLWKTIWILFYSIAEGLPSIMKNNIIDMASTATFAGLCSFEEIFHYIFAQSGL